MRISHKHKFIFIAVPKTGSTSLRHVLDPLSDISGGMNSTSGIETHTTAKQLQQYFKHNNLTWNDYYSFGFTRNPWDICVSGYFFYKQRIDPPTDYGKQCKRLANTHSFEWWVENKCTSHIFSQYAFFHDDDGNKLVDRIGKIENLQEDFNQISDEIGIPRVELPRLNTSKHRDYRSYHTDKTIQIIADLYARDIQHFKYKF